MMVFLQKICNGWWGEVSQMKPYAPMLRLFVYEGLTAQISCDTILWRTSASGSGVKQFCGLLVLYLMW